MNIIKLANNHPDLFEFDRASWIAWLVGIFEFSLNLITLIALQIIFVTTQSPEDCIIQFSVFIVFLHFPDFYFKVNEIR